MPPFYFTGGWGQGEEGDKDTEGRNQTNKILESGEIWGPGESSKM